MHIIPSIHRQTGASLVGTMIGAAIGLFILAGGTKLYVDYIQSNRQYMLTIRLNQELRAVTDLVARDLKRAGYWGNAKAGISTGAGMGVTNAYAPITISSDPAVLRFQYATDMDNAVAGMESYGYRLQNGKIEMSNDGGANWGELTDANATVVTGFSLVANSRVVSLAEYCPNTLPAGTLPPTMAIRIFNLTITGHSKADPTIRRQVQESVRVRADQISGACLATT